MFRLLLLAWGHYLVDRAHKFLACSLISKNDTKFDLYCSFEIYSKMASCDSSSLFNWPPVNALVTSKYQVTHYPKINKIDSISGSWHPAENSTFSPTPKKIFASGNKWPSVYQKLIRDFVNIYCYYFGNNLSCCYFYLRDMQTLRIGLKSIAVCLFSLKICLIVDLLYLGVSGSFASR